MISELFPEEKRRLFDLEQQLLELERGSTTIQASDVWMGINEMSQRLENLDRLAASEPKARRDDYRRRIVHLRTTHTHLKSGLDIFMRKRDKSSFVEIQRQQLLSGFGGGTGSPYIDVEMAENSSLLRSKKAVGEYIANSQESLSELFSQRDRLKGIHRKVLDIMNYLGLSNSIMKSVERRETVDGWIVFIGIVVVVALLVFIVFFWKRR